MLAGIFSKPTVDIIIDAIPNRKRFKIKDNSNNTTVLPTFRSNDTISGKIVVNLNSIKSSFEHKGIKLELIGLLESAVDNKSDAFTFISLSNELETNGALGTTITTWPFKFTGVELKYETYKGTLKQVRYVIRLTIEVKLRTLVYEQEFAVLNPEPRSVLEEADAFQLEIGVEDWLLLYFHIDKMAFALKDSVIGSVLFKNIGIKLQTMELHIIKREMVLQSDNSSRSTVDSPSSDNSANINNKTMAKYQIMDGGPTKNERVVIRFPLKTYVLTPTYPNIANKFAVRYFMNIVLFDIEDRKYTKQHEIFMHRIDKKL